MKHQSTKLILASFFMSLPAQVNAVEPVNSEMVITATRIERQLFNIPQATTVISDVEIEQANKASTPDILSTAEGVYMQKTNMGGGSPFIRGLTGKQVLIMIDGIRLNNSFYRFGPHQYLNTIDPNIIERIEVVRGPGSVLYGSDALGGVINIITKKRTNFSQASDLDGLAQFNYYSAMQGTGLRIQAEGNSGHFGYLAGITTKDYGELYGGGDVGKQIPTAYKENNVDLKFNWQLDAREQLVLNLQQTDQQDVPKTSEVTLGSKAKFNYEPQLRQLAYLEYQAENLTLFDAIKINVSYNRQKEGEEIISRNNLSTETREITDVKTIGTGLQFTTKLVQQRFVYGLDYYADKYTSSKQSIDLNTNQSTNLIPGTPDGASYDSLGLYLQDEIKINQYAEVILGLRYSKYKAQGQISGNQLKLNVNATTGSFHGLYHITPRWNLVGGVAQGYRAPNIEDFFGRVDFFSEIPNTKLKPEQVLSYDIGFKYYSMASSANIYFYRSDYQDLIDRITVGTDGNGDPIKQRRNVNEAKIIGIETGLQHEFNRNWRFNTSLIWTEGSDKKTGTPLRRIPPLNGILQIRYTTSPKLWWELETLYATKQNKLSNGDIDDKRIPDGGTPGYTVFNIKSGFNRIKGEQILVTLENISDKKYKTHGSGIYAAGIGINVSYKLSF